MDAVMERQHMDGIDRQLILYVCEFSPLDVAIHPKDV